ncbi:MAG: 1,4-dihydroxy-2-naphthoate octaprenyltransferase [Chthoniobacterales bacterium]
MTGKILWRATRAYSLPASIVPVVLGTALAARGYAELGGGHFNATTFVITLLGAMLAHFGANVINDYFDFIKGVDTKPEHGSGVLTSGEMTPKQTLTFAVVLFALAGACAVILLRRDVAVVMPLAALGLACAVLYPAFLKRYGLGDLLIIVAFGLGLTLGSYGVQASSMMTRQWLLVSFYSVPICLLVDAILHANNLRDAPDDRAARVRTLATALGPKRGRMLQAVLLCGPLLFVVLGVVTRLLPVWSLVTALSLPLLLRAFRSGSVPGTAQTHLVFGVLYAVSFLPPPVFV